MLGNNTKKYVSSCDVFCERLGRLPSIDPEDQLNGNEHYIAGPLKADSHEHSCLKYGELQLPQQKDHRLQRRTDRILYPAKHDRILYPVKHNKSNLGYFCLGTFYAHLLPF